MSQASLVFSAADPNLAVTETIFGGTAPYTLSRCLQAGIAVASAAFTSTQTFRVTPLSSGLCTLTVTDAQARTATVTVSVTTTSITFRSKVRRPK